MKENSTEPNRRDDDAWEDLILSVLSVNKWPVQKTYASLDALRNEGLCEPKKLARMGPDQVVLRLKRAGYDRGEFMNGLFAQRLSSLAAFAMERGVECCVKALHSSERKDLEQFFAVVNGVGPKVIENFCLLRGF
jgi:hypothetical protein